MEEKWKTIEGYPGYQVSSLGRVKSIERNVKGRNGSIRTIKGKILKPNKNRYGYLMVPLNNKGIQKYMSIHRLVASAFVQNESLFNNEINHLDENKENNCASNLEWSDRKHNCNFGSRNERLAKSNINHPKRSKKIKCLETGVVYPSINEVERQLGFSHCHISQCCRGKRNTCGKLHWKYVD